VKYRNALEGAPIKKPVPVSLPDYAFRMVGLLGDNGHVVPMLLQRPGD
jgi:hypothetical protein